MESTQDEFSKLLASNGVTPKVLSEVTGISQPMISQIRKGRRSPSTDSIVRLASAINVPATELVRIFQPDVWRLFNAEAQ